MSESLPADWHRDRLRALVLLGITMASCGLAMLAIVGAVMSGDQGMVVGCMGLALGAIGLVAFVSAMLLLGRSRASAQLNIALVVLAVGVSGTMIIGALELSSPMPGVRVAHAVAGLLALSSILAGVVLSRPGFARLMREFAVDDVPAASIGRRLRATIYAALAFGLVVPFIPLWLSSITPRDCAVWTAVIAATAFAIPPFVAVWSIGRLNQLVIAAQANVTHCPRCGYQRPPGTRCSECGDAPSV